MKVVAFNGSPRKNGNTYHALKTVCQVLEQNGIETEIVQVGGKLLWGCQGCNSCRENPEHRCILGDDGMNGFFDKMVEADGILIGSPVYYGNVSTETKALIDRCGMLAGANGAALKRKVGAPVIAVRRAGSNFTYAAINYFFGISQMIIPTSRYWNMTLALNEGDYEKDAEGIETFRVLGENMAWLLKKLED